MQQIKAFLNAVFLWPLKALIRTNPVSINVAQEIKVDPLKPIIYLLQTSSVSDKIAIRQACQQLNLPVPRVNDDKGFQSPARFLYLNRPDSLFFKSSDSSKIYRKLETLVTEHRANADLDVQLIPVSLCWGRTPERTVNSWFGLLAERTSPNWLRKLFIILFLGRDNFVSFSRAVSIREMAEKYGDDSKLSQKLIRVARVHFYRRRQAMTGPNHIDKQQLINAILAKDSVKQALKTEQAAKQLSAAKARELATKYIKEIAADYNDNLIRLSDRILRKVWNKIYSGIEVHHAEKVRELANAGHEIIYVPCHRSHMDYVLLTYVIYHQGLVTPHIAAGINLNFWPLGGFFRRAGAFFLRRSFGGNKVYTAVFKEYLEHLFCQGVPVKFYPEGGRSRTGRLLNAKTGMLAMTVQSAIRNRQRPISLVPVYIGYEHVMEVGSYLKELKGTGKKKESLSQTFSAITKLKNYGHGFLNFGAPIGLPQFLAGYSEGELEITDKRPTWFNDAVSDLAVNVMEGVNHAVALNNMTLCSVCLLAAPNRALPEVDLKSTLGHFLQLFSAAPYSSLFTMPEASADEILDGALALKKFKLSEDSFGKIIGFDEQSAIAHTYYRNNVIHVFALPALIASAVIQHKGIEKAELLKIIESIYPMLKKELFMYFSLQQALDYAEKLIVEMKSAGLLVQGGRKLQAPDKASQAYLTLSLLNNLLQDTLQRYAIVLTIIENRQGVTRLELESHSVKVAERLAALHGINAPEFYDKNVLKGFVAGLKQSGLVDDSESGLVHSEQSRQLHNKIMALVQAEIAQSIYSLQSLN